MKQEHFSSIVKFRVWDTIENKWFQTKFDRHTGELREILMSQNGELFLHECAPGGVPKITAQTDYEGEQGRYLRDVYTGAKDADGRRYFFNDIIRFDTGLHNSHYAVLFWTGHSLAAGFGPVGDYTSWVLITEHELRKTTNVGSIYENKNLIPEKAGPDSTFN
jgi:hypothetical protein